MDRSAGGSQDQTERRGHVLAFFSGGVMAAILYMAIFMLPDQMKMNLFMMLGSMMLPVGAAAFVMGAMAHAGMSVVMGLIHGAVFAAADIDSAEWAWGLLFGLVHIPASVAAKSTRPAFTR